MLIATIIKNSLVLYTELKASFLRMHSLWILLFLKYLDFYPPISIYTRNTRISVYFYFSYLVNYYNLIGSNNFILSIWSILL